MGGGQVLLSREPAWISSTSRGRQIEAGAGSNSDRKLAMAEANRWELRAGVGHSCYQARSSQSYSLPIRRTHTQLGSSFLEDGNSPGYRKI